MMVVEPLNFDVMFAGLVWLPIEEYDKASDATTLLRNKAEWNVGYWGLGELLPGDWGYGDVPEDRVEMFRSATDWCRGTPLNFVPDEFAILTEKWQHRLMED